MPLTKEQFQKAQEAGFSTDQIIGFEKQREEETITESPSFINQVKQVFLDTPKALVAPLIKIAGVTGLGVNDIIDMVAGNKQPVPEYDVPFLGGKIPVRRMKTLPQAVGLGMQGSAYLIPGAKVVQGALAGGMFGVGGAMEEQKNLPEILKQGVLGSVLGGATSKAVSVALGEPFLTGKTGEIINSGINKVEKPFKIVGRGFKKYKSIRKGSQFEGVRRDLTPMERVKNLENIAKEKYTIPLKQEEEKLTQQLKNISTKEKVVLEKSKEAIKQSKLNLSQDVDNLSSKMKEETVHLRDNIELASQKSAIEGKRRFSQFTNENSSSYGNKLDDIINIAEQEGKLPTKQVLQDIFDKTDAEIASTFIDTGAPLTKYNALKDKYISGLSAEANPEAQAMSKALGCKKGQPKNAGIDWSRAEITGGAKPPNPNAPINLKGLLQDIRSVKKAMSTKAKGAERAFTDEDLVSIMFQKNVGEHMATNYPEFAKLQKNYAPIIEQMKAGRKIFKPGAPYEIGTAPGVLKEPNILEKKLINELEQGTPGFNKGIGEISQPIKKAQQKLAGTEKGYEIAKQRIEKLNAKEQQELGELLKIREEAYALAKEKVTVKSMIRQKQIKDNLNQRLQDLETGKFKGEVGVSKKIARQKITGREKKIATGGGIATMADYLIRRIVARGVLK